MVRKANAQWNGNLKQGNGTVTLESGVLSDSPYSFNSRFEDGKAVNPEELVAAAHAGCFAMALSNTLSMEGFTVNSVKAEAKVHLGKVDEKTAITKIEIECVGDVEGIDESKFNDYAEQTKKGCIISRALSSVDMSVNAKLK